MTTFSSTLRIAKPVDGALAGTWGQTVNSNMELIEDAIDGYVTINFAADADRTLTTANGASDEARVRNLLLTGSLTQTRRLLVPAGVPKTYRVYNFTNQAIEVTVSGTPPPAGGPGAVVPVGIERELFCDGASVRWAQTFGIGAAYAEFFQRAFPNAPFGVGQPGLVPPRPDGTVNTRFLREDGLWVVPAGGGGGGGGGDMVRANNLSDLINAATARANLGLGTAAQQNTGTAGATVPLLNGTNYHSDARGVDEAATDWYQFGFRRLRPASINSGTPVAKDSDSCIYANGAVTLPPNVFVIGDVLAIYNNTGSGLTITQGVGLTLRLAGSASTGDRTLAQRGLATVLFISATEAVISGSVT